MAEGDTIVNAVLGALAGIILSFLPGSTILGGAVAGYLQGGDRRDGVRVGLLAGVLMIVPFLVIAFLLANLVYFLVGGGLTATVVFVLFLFSLFVGLVYVVGFAAIGGYLGHYVRDETDLAR